MSLEDQRATPGGDPVLVLGAGYAGISVARKIVHLTGGRVRVKVVDRVPAHVLRNELFKLDRMARDLGDEDHWSIPVTTALDGAALSTDFVEGTVESIDLDSRTVRVDGRDLPYAALAIGLGSVPAYYHVPGAEANTFRVYGLRDALRTAQEIRRWVVEFAKRHSQEGPRIVVVGGGSTGTEVAAEIATADWSVIAGGSAPRPKVELVTGTIPFLAGLHEGAIRHARSLLGKSGVRLVEGRNVRSVAPHELALEDGTTLPFELGIWCAGVEAPPLLRSLPIPHGHGGRLKVEPTLELPGYPGAFGVGDVIEIHDPRTGVPVPATAQAALAEAPVAARNLVARRDGRPLVPFHYRETTTLVSVGERSAVGEVHHVPVWGRPAHLLKEAGEREYSSARRHGNQPWGL